MKGSPLAMLGRSGRELAAGILNEQAHRPWPLPDRPWHMFQSWQDLLFAHWPLPASAIAKLIPPGLVLDSYAGEAWVTLVPFRMSGIRQRFTPAAPWISAFPELNVRTYVKSTSTKEPKPGVFFFSLDAGNPLAVAMARRTYHLPYFRAKMTSQMHDDGIRYTSRRTHRGAPEAEFRALYRPTGPAYQAADSSLERWLIERYCLYSVDSRGNVYRGEIHHAPWPLQPAEVEFERNWVAQGHGIFIPDTEPLLHFARKQDVLTWQIEEVIK